MKTIILLFCSLVILSATGGCDDSMQNIQETESQKATKAIKIGVIAPLSGPEKMWGKNGLLGIKTAIKLHPLLNNGSKIELVVEDDQNQPLLTRKALIKLVTEDDVSSVLVMSTSESVLSLAEVADTYKTPIFALASTHPDVTKDNNYISQLLFDDQLQASVAALYARDELLIDNVVVVVDDQNPHSFYLAMEFITKFESIGGSSSEISLSRDEAVLLAKLKFLQEANIGFLYIPLDAVHVVTIAKLLDTIDWHPGLMGSDGLQATIFLQHSESIDLVSGMLATDPYSTIMSQTDYGKEIIKLFHGAFDTHGTVFAAQGAEGASILISAINRCYSTIDRSCINEMLRSTHEFIGIHGKIDIKANGKSERPIFVNVIDGSELHFKVKVY